MIGFIYKITPLNSEYFYIGSSYDIDKRKRGHKNASKIKQTKLYKTIRECGDFEMIILYEFECENKTKLRLEEQKWIDKLKPQLNIVRAFNSDEDRLEFGRKYHQKYYEDNKEKFNKYYDANKDKINERTRQYNHDNRDAIIEKRRLKCVCDCGVSVCKSSLKKHKRTTKHEQLMMNLNDRPQ